MCVRLACLLGFPPGAVFAVDRPITCSLTNLAVKEQVCLLFESLALIYSLKVFVVEIVPLAFSLGVGYVVSA